MRLMRSGICADICRVMISARRFTLTTSCSQLTLSLLPCQRQAVYNAHGAFPERAVSLQGRHALLNGATAIFKSVPVYRSLLEVGFQCLRRYAARN